MDQSTADFAKSTKSCFANLLGQAYTPTLDGSPTGSNLDQVKLALNQQAEWTAYLKCANPGMVAGGEDGINGLF